MIVVLLLRTDIQRELRVLAEGVYIYIYIYIYIYSLFKTLLDAINIGEVQGKIIAESLRYINVRKG
jgi:hypothetical protein